ncbi:MAG: hypothetical protein AAFV53_30720 [Myxococcota bacterium]
MYDCATPPPEIRSDDALQLLASQAEDVRAYLVNLRGGAPFLSGADSQLLLNWLSDGVPVPVILASIDRVAVRRRKRRTRGRISLHACRGEVRRMMGRGRARPAPRRSAPGGLARLAIQIAALTIAPVLAPHRDALADELSKLDKDGPADLEDRARQAITASRRFHESVWETLTDQRQALLDDAAAELEPLKTLLKGTAWAAAVEEVARDRVRARFPLVSAQVIWDRLQDGSTPSKP